jgi:GNAT superfamily N-acetyltransferase
MGGTKHWYVRYLATRPEYQGKGAAGKLLQWLIDRADEDEDGCELYLEGSPAGQPLFKRFRWTEVDKVVMKLEGDVEEAVGEKEYTELCMVRRAGGITKR